MAGLDRHAHHRAGRAIDAAGQIDRDHRAAGGVHRLDHRPRRPGHFAVEASTEQRIDDKTAAGELLGRGRIDRTLPALGGNRRIAAQFAFVADEADAHLKVSVLGQMPRRHEAVAAIVAGPGDDDDARRRLGNPVGKLGDRDPRALHQLDAWHAAGDGQPVGLRHLVGGQKLVHAADPNGPSWNRQFATTRCAAT